MRLALAAACTAALSAPAAWALGNFENPPNGTVSGASLVAGWHCTATRIDIEFDGGTRTRAASGTDRPDTAGVCGRRDTGFGLLVNWADLGPGTHIVRAYADGELMDTRTVTVVTYGVVYLDGKSATTTVPDFPSEGRETVLEWRQGLQGFMASEVRVAPAIGGIWNGANLERRSHCASASNNGTRGTYAQWSVTRDTVSDRLRIVETGITGLSCTYAGGYRIAGNKAEWYDGTYTCTDGKTGTFNSSDITVTDNALSIRLAIKLNGSESCDIDAIIGGSRF
ncbi:MAG TPA: hypothetical protein VM073_07180 [Usitatibacter sp.]|nr:hypothetical protein [Usitatibacter sp.]